MPTYLYVAQLIVNCEIKFYFIFYFCYVRELGLLFVLFFCVCVTSCICTVTIKNNHNYTIQNYIYFRENIKIKIIHGINLHIY